MLVLASAAMTNIRRIQWYREKLREEKRKAREAQKQMQDAIKNVFVSFWGFLQRCLLQCVIRTIPTTDSDVFRPPIPAHSDHLRSVFSRIR